MFEYAGNGFLVMEFVPGQSLEDILERQKRPLLESQVLGYALQICDVLTYLHSLNPPIIHRDIKPANIRLTPEGLIKLVDFGLLKQGTQATANSRRGLTPAYAPLEQWGGALRTDARSDIYSLGATLFHCVTGQEPPTATDRISSVHDTLPPILQLNPSLSRPVALAIVTALKLQPQDRYGDVLMFKRALQGLAESTSAPHLVATPTPQPARVPAAQVVVRKMAPDPTPLRQSPQQTPAPVAQVAARQAASPLIVAGAANPAATPKNVVPQSRWVLGNALPGVDGWQFFLAALVAALASFSSVATNFGLFFISWFAAFMVSIYIHTHKGGVISTAFVATCLLGPLSVALALITPPLVNKRLIYQTCSRRRNTLLALIIIPCILLVFVYPGFILFLWPVSATVAEYIFVSKRRKPLWMFLLGIIIGPLAVLIAALVRRSRTVPQQA